MGKAPDPKRDRPGDDAPPAGPGLRLWHLMILTAFVAVLVRGLVEFEALLDVWSVVLLVVLLALALGISAVAALVARGSTRREGLLQLMTIAAGKGLPPGPAIGAYAELCEGRYRRKLRAVAGNLEAGTPLPEALDRVPGVLPAGVAAALRVGWEVGAPARALRDAASAEAAWRPHRKAVLRPLIYGLVLLLATPPALGILLLRFPSIFLSHYGNLNHPMPPTTRFLHDAGQALADSPALGVAVTLLELAALATLMVLASSYFGWSTLNIYPLNRLERRRHAAAILRALALVVEGGKPMVPGLGTLARLYPRRWVRRRLARAEERAIGGEDWLRALRAEGLVPAADAAVLESAQRAGNLAWALRELAEGNERRAGYRVRVWSQVLTPAVVLAAGALVGLLGAAYILPLSELVQEMSR